MAWMLDCWAPFFDFVLAQLDAAIGGVHHIVEIGHALPGHHQRDRVHELRGASGEQNGHQLSRRENGHALGSGGFPISGEGVSQTPGA